MNIGVYSPNWVGDAVMALKFIGRLRKQYADDKLIVIARDWVAAIFDNHPLINKVLPVPTKELAGVFNTIKTGRSFQKLNLDIFFVLPDSFRSAVIAWFSKSNTRIGFAGQMREPFLTDQMDLPKEAIHRSEKYIYLIQNDEHAQDFQHVGITLREQEIKWANEILQENNVQDPIGLLTGSIAKSRSVSIGKWIEIAKDKSADDNKFVIIGEKRDAGNAQKIIAQVGADRVISFCGKHTLRESIALISRCRAVIAADSGLGHIAADLDIPTISLFGAGDPEKTRPLGDLTQVVTANVHCSPCGDNICGNTLEPMICLDSISSTQVWNTYSDLHN
ncbi:MAG: lipopolysaccharide heptosyltransferase II [Candidatus Marinimicrobia bacterium]|nr:lipopolysaccharide heptosyltransferase II [Candidatus Neomarinimicrobiota bacterium]